MSLTEPTEIDPPASAEHQPATSALVDKTTERAAARNFSIMAGFQVVMRCGWIFKTESIIMPLVLDLLGGGAWVRSCLPVLNRFGQSIPPLLMTRRVKVMPLKKYLTAVCASVMAASFLALSAIWAVYGTSGAWWLPLAFLSLYAVFFASTGVNQLGYQTLQGKLIPATQRGRLMLAANVVGAVAAIALAALLLPHWLSDDAGRFDLIFGFSGICFGGSALLALFLVETHDHYEHPPSGVFRLFHDVWTTVRHDSKFRRLTVISALFGTSVMLFPHYQALGRGERMGIGLREIITWVIVQNAGTALFSMIAGPIADWRGNRTVLRMTLLTLCAAPVSAIALSHAESLGQRLFPLVFVLVGLTPVCMKILHNYALEFASPEDHPRYISAVSIAMAAPIFLSPLVGVLIVPLGFDVVFLGIGSIVFAGWLMTFGLHEPRH